MTTLTETQTYQTALDKANPNLLADLLAAMKLGTLLTPLKRTFTGLTAAASFDLTAIDGTGETTGASNPNRLAALSVTTLRVTSETSGTDGTGSYVVTDVDGTMLDPTNSTAAGVARISDDGTTITFPEADVTGFVITYIPRAQVTMTSAFPPAE